MAEISYGTWPLGGIKDAEPELFDAGVTAVRLALEAGVRSFDTAELYGCGEAEKILGEAIKDIPREELFLASKVRGSNASYKAIKKACENSLARVWVAQFDLYYIHWREDQFDLEDCMKAMEELVDEGKIKYIGVSNFSTETMKKAQSYCKKYKIVANQVHYNLILRAPELDGLLTHCQENDVMLVSYRPFELWKIPNGSKLYDYQKNYNKTAGQLGINWITSQKNVVTIFQSQSQDHIQEAVGTDGWNMNSDDIEYLRENYVWQVPVSDCIPLR